MTGGLVSRGYWLGKPHPCAQGFGQSPPRARIQSHPRLTSAAPAQTLAPFLLHPHSRRNPPSPPLLSATPPPSSLSPAASSSHCLVLAADHGSAMDGGCQEGKDIFVFAGSAGGRAHTHVLFLVEGNSSMGVWPRLGTMGCPRCFMVRNMCAIFQSILPSPMPTMNSAQFEAAKVGRTKKA